MGYLKMSVPSVSYELDSKMIMKVSMIWRELVIACVKVLPFHSSGKAGVNQRNTHLSSETVTICVKVCNHIGTPCRLQGTNG
jgi:hypothetical protein